MNDQDSLHVLWVNREAHLAGRAERFIAQSVARLCRADVRSTFMYDPNCTAVATDVLQTFDAAFPIVELGGQLAAIAPDVIYIHDLPDTNAWHGLAASGLPLLQHVHNDGHHILEALQSLNVPTASKRSVAVPTRDLAERLEREGFDPASIFVVPSENGNDGPPKSGMNLAEETGERTHIGRLAGILAGLKCGNAEAWSWKAESQNVPPDHASGDA